MDWFIKEAFNPDTRFYYGAMVLTLIFSIVMHELSHGWAAIHQGDDTPIRLGRMTGNPLVHMGPISLALIFLAGIGWGLMPVNPSRFRSKYGDAIVAAAGPAMNLLLALVALTALGLWQRFAGVAEPPTDAAHIAHNGQNFLWIFGFTNIALAIFNMAPVIPLDGSAILGNFSHSYRRWVYNNAHAQQLLFFGYFILISALNQTPYSLWHVSSRAASGYLALFFLF